MDKIAFGKFMTTLREEKNLTQEKLALEFDVTNKTVSKWECGNAIPETDKLIKICNFFDVSLYELTVIYKRNKNPFITNNQLSKINSKKEELRITIVKFSILIILIIVLFVMLLSTIYTVSNYNKFIIYDLVSADDSIFIEGILVKNHDEYYLSLNKILYANNSELFDNDKTNTLKYTITAKNVINISNSIILDDYHYVKDILTSVNLFISSKPLIANITTFDLNIQYINIDKVIVTKTFKINLSIQKSNNKLFYW